MVQTILEINQYCFFYCQFLKIGVSWSEFFWRADIVLFLQFNFLQHRSEQLYL